MISLMVLLHKNPLQIKTFHNVVEQSLEEGHGNNMKSEASVLHGLYSSSNQLFDLFKSSVPESPEGKQESHMGGDQSLHGMRQVEISTQKSTSNTPGEI
jgi:hypothetical protein